MSDLGFKGGTYALLTHSLIESSVKSAEAPATNLSNTKFPNDRTIESSVRSAGAPAANVTDAKLDLLIEMLGNFLHRHRFACQNLKHDILDIKAALADTTIISDYHCKTQHHLDSRLNRVKYDGIHCCGTGEPLSIVSVNIQDSRTIVSNKCEEFPYEDILESPSSIGELLSACLNNTILTTPEYARSAVFSTHREYNCRELIVPGFVCCKLQYKCTYNPYAAFFELFHDIIQVDTYLTLGIILECYRCDLRKNHLVQSDAAKLAFSTKKNT